MYGWRNKKQIVLIRVRITCCNVIFRTQLNALVFWGYTGLTEKCSIQETWSKQRLLLLLVCLLLLLDNEGDSSAATRLVGFWHTFAARIFRIPSYRALARAMRRVLYASNDRSSSVILRGGSGTCGSGRGRAARVVSALRSSP